jgi:nucleotide-binding universal stress UspA family protein
MKLIAFVDGSSYSASVIDHAAWAAKRKDASVEVFHMLGRRERSSEPADLSGSLRLGARGKLLEELSRADSERAKLAHARGRLILEDAKTRLMESGVAEVETRLRNDDIVDTVKAFEPGADIVVIGKRGEASGFALEHLGSNLERILRSATKPVLVASRAFRPIERYMIAFDAGPSVMKAVGHIADGQLFRDMPCLLLHVGDDTPDIRSRMEGAAAMLKTAGQDVEIEIARGEPEKVISGAVETRGVGLLLMGAYGHSRIRNLIIGSTTTQMVRSCKIPVMMFR